jgi:hypothetical protein
METEGVAKPTNLTRSTRERMRELRPHYFEREIADLLECSLSEARALPRLVAQPQELPSFDEHWM